MTEPSPNDAGASGAAAHAAAPPAAAPDDGPTVVEMAVRVGILVLWATWCFRILQPFFALLLWSVIIAVAVNPMHKRMARALGDRAKTAAAALTLLLLVVVVGPVVVFAFALVDNVRTLVGYVQAEDFAVPPAPIGIEEWPVVGPSLKEFWDLASYNLGAALERLGPSLQAAGSWALEAVAGVSLDLLQFAAAIVVAGVLVVHSRAGHRLSRGIARRLARDRGDELAKVAETTLRGVSRGIMGVALIQALLTGLGLVVAGVPLAGIWTLVALLLCVVQVGPALVLVPAIFWVFTHDTAVVGSLFLAWSVFITLIDNVLRPLLMGRGVDVPLAVILLGSLGGMMLSGLIGLFIGAVILALGHRLFVTWLHMHHDEAMLETFAWHEKLGDGDGG